jgi:anti-anti-sigma regulatory factor
MPFEAQIEGSGVRLVLTGRLGVPQARSLWDRVQNCLAGVRPLSVDAAGLVDMDTSIVQILFRLKSSPGGVHIVADSPGFTDALKRRGLEETFSAEAARIDAVETQVATLESNIAANKEGPNV